MLWRGQVCSWSCMLAPRKSMQALHATRFPYVLIIFSSPVILFHVTDTLIRRPDGSVGMALVLPALTDCRWWFESLLVHSGVSSATRRKATGADHKKRNWYADYQSCCLALVLFLCVCFFVVFACLFGCFFRPTPSWLSPGRSTCLFGCFPCVFSFVLWLQVSALWIMYRSNSVLFCGHMVQTVVATASIWLICWLPSAFWLDKRPGESHLALDGKKCSLPVVFVCTFDVLCFHVVSLKTSLCCAFYWRKPGHTTPSWSAVFMCKLQSFLVVFCFGFVLVTLRQNAGLCIGPLPYEDSLLMQ